MKKQTIRKRQPKQAKFCHWLFFVNYSSCGNQTDECVRVFDEKDKVKLYKIAQKYKLLEIEKRIKQDQEKLIDLQLQ
jgi:hypothetical protein